VRRGGSAEKIVPESEDVGVPVDDGILEMGPPEVARVVGFILCMRSFLCGNLRALCWWWV